MKDVMEICGENEGERCQSLASLFHVQNVVTKVTFVTALVVGKPLIKRFPISVAFHTLFQRKGATGYAVSKSKASMYELIVHSQPIRARAEHSSHQTP